MKTYALRKLIQQKCRREIPVRVSSCPFKDKCSTGLFLSGIRTERNRSRKAVRSEARSQNGSRRFLRLHSFPPSFMIMYILQEMR